MSDIIISADCHVDLIWLPPELFTSNAKAELADRMPYVTDGEDGPAWVSRKGAYFGLQNGMGSAGRMPAEAASGRIPSASGGPSIRICSGSSASSACSRLAAEPGP